MACSPLRHAIRYSTYISRVTRYCTIDREYYQKIQNSGILVGGSYDGEKFDFYEVIVDIIDLKCLGEFVIYLFKCNWCDLSNPPRAMHDDAYILGINTLRKWYDDDAFVLAYQVSQVFYLDDPDLGSQ